MVSAFATPIANYRWPDSGELNAELAALVLDEESREPGVSRSNIGGWHSGLDFLDREAPMIAALRDRIENFVTDLNEAVFSDDADRQPRDFSLEGWANVLRDGGYNSLHSHPNSFWSGVYYVTGNNASDEYPFSGKLELVDPRPGASLEYVDSTRLYGRFLVNPSPGQMIVFPSWLQHFVHPCRGNEPRISIAFNASL
jgi:uncharacterized protein (TIGR02466 family)